MTCPSIAATCWREGAAWVVHLDDVDRSARASSLAHVAAVARELVATAADAPADARVVLQYSGRSTVADLVAAAAAARKEADRVSVEWGALRRDLARRLADEGFSIPDVAALLGVSFGRACQLVNGVGVHSGSRQVRHVSPVSSTKPHGSYRHEAFFYEGDDAFLAGIVPFVRDGVTAGQPVMVAVTNPRLSRLQAALADDARHVYFVDMAELGQNPARIIPGWRAFVDEHAGPGRPVRGVGEPIWSGRRPSEISECQVHEALLNLVVEPDTPLWLRCPYDTRALDRPTVLEAERSHPALVDSEDYRGSTTYGGAHHASEMFAGELPEPIGAVRRTAFTGADLAEVRRQVTHHAIDTGLGASRAADLTLALGEITTNSVRHGGGGGTLSVWHGTESQALVFDVADEGYIQDPLVGRRHPGPSDRGGRGVWLANQLCDLVQIRSSPRGTKVRIHAWS